MFPVSPIADGRAQFAAHQRLAIRDAKVELNNIFKKK